MVSKVTNRPIRCNLTSLLVVESGVSLGDLWVKSVNLLWSWIWEVLNTGGACFFQWDCFSLSIERGMSFGNLRVKERDLLDWTVTIGGIFYTFNSINGLSFKLLSSFGSGIGFGFSSSLWFSLSERVFVIERSVSLSNFWIKE
jgi:hypothetical protein